jgi:hypothetical protein
MTRRNHDGDHAFTATVFACAIAVSCARVLMFHQDNTSTMSKDNTIKDCLLPAPFTMCFSAECKERQDEHQVSIFEATADTFTLLPTQRILDSQLAVAKYRRSTATRKRPPRSLFQILATWNHLLQVVFVEQKTFENMPRQSLLTTSAFCDDRIRALQVDLVLSQENSAELQFQLIKYHFVNMYLLSEKMTSTKCWEPKFARRALWTALTAFWNNTHDANYKDEVLCLTALCQLATRVVQDEEYCKNVVLAWQDAGSSHTSTSYGNILLLANHCVENGKYPKFLHALRIVSTCMLEMYQTTLQMICDDLPFEEEFNVICRICMAPALTMLRLGALRHYNKAFGKFEHVCGKEVSTIRDACLYDDVEYYTSSLIIILLRLPSWWLQSRWHDSCIYRRVRLLSTFAKQLVCPLKRIRW